MRAKSKIAPDIRTRNKATKILIRVRLIGGLSYSSILQHTLSILYQELTRCDSVPYWRYAVYRSEKNYDLVFAFDSGVHMGATHMFVMHQLMGCSGRRNDFCERYFYVMPDQNVREEIAKQQGALIETYDLSKPKDQHLEEHVTETDFLMV